MKRDRLMLLALIGLLALAILVQIAGQGMLNHWRAQRAYSKPDPKEVPQPPKPSRSK